MWTLDELVSSCDKIHGTTWRLVEGVARVSTLKLVDTLEEQEILEGILDRSKPKLPPDCDGLHFLLSTPFRYAPYPNGSRFRAANNPDGVFYGAESVETAVAELAFYRFLFFQESPDAQLPAKPVEQTAFRSSFAANSSLDLTSGKLERFRTDWLSPADYRRCQQLAEDARKVGVQAIRYQSVRCPDHGKNIAILSPKAFRGNKPDKYMTWHIYVRKDVVQTICEMPRMSIEFKKEIFATDIRLNGTATSGGRSI